MSCSILNNPWNEDQWDALFWCVPWGWEQSDGQVAKEQLRRDRAAGYIKNYIFRKIKCIKNVPTVSCKAWIYNLCVTQIRLIVCFFSWHIWVLFLSYCDSMEVCVCVCDFFFQAHVTLAYHQRKRREEEWRARRGGSRSFRRNCFHSATAMWTLSSV